MYHATGRRRSAAAALAVLLTAAAIPANAQVASGSAGSAADGRDVAQSASTEQLLDYPLYRLNLDLRSLRHLDNLRLLPFEQQGGGARDERSYQEGMKAMSEG